MKKIFTVEYEEGALNYQVIKALFLMQGADEKIAQRLANEYAKHFQCEIESF
jgi:hypothetical protein